jgi:hypothetical protein
MNAATPSDIRANGTTRSIVVLGVVVAMYIVVAIYAAAAFYRGYQPSVGFYRASDLIFPLLLAIWVDEDSRGRPEVTWPSFDMGFFISLIWILYLPWYLLRTRGPRGWLWIAGLLGLVFLGPILQWLIYAAS